MKRIASILAAALCATALSAQVYVTESPGLQQQIIGSGFIHSPLPVCRENSFETRSSAKDIVLDEPLEAKHSDWHFEGTGSLSFRDSIDGSDLILEHPVHPGNRAAGPPEDPDYATYGVARMVCDLHGRDLRGFNRISLDIYPD